MMKNATSVGSQKAWTKPELSRLGQISDVAGGPPVPVQNINNS